MDDKIGKEVDNTDGEVDTMAATARNFVFEVKNASESSAKREAVISKEFLEDCKKVAEKYRKKK